MKEERKKILQEKKEILKEKVQRVQHLEKKL